MAVYKQDLVYSKSCNRRDMGFERCLNHSKFITVMRLSLRFSSVKSNLILAKNYLRKRALETKDLTLSEGSGSNSHYVSFRKGG